MKEGFQDHAGLEETMVAVYEGSTVWKAIQEAWRVKQRQNGWG